MLKMTGTICIEASATRSWEVLSDIESIAHWSEAVQTARSVGKVSKGVGAHRVCKLSNKMSINEEWIDWQEGQSYTYVAYDLPLVKCAKNTWSIREEEGKTYLTTDSEVVIKGGLFGRLLEPLMRLATAKMGADAMAALKYLIENGAPYQGKHSSLPRPMAVC